ncbi:MAG TPA: class I mannose-6-phosphate isomerase [Planctomycetota bacterium]|nr:class I mannose-6-phosphate isomerase [Planctomycetota bacterium]
MSPFLRTQVWGGDHLAAYGKAVKAGDKVGESWEVSGHRDGLSRVASGPLAGKTLPELVAEFGADLVGTGVPTDRPFPLLIKLIDAAEQLSVQVHPSDEYCAAHRLADPGKPEAWYILEAAPGARIWKGLLPGTTPEKFEALLAAGRLQECLRSFPAAAGDCIDLPAGVIHAIGAGILMAEVQQTSDLTYRVFDWNRLGLDGKPRQLHVREALETIDFASLGGSDFGDKVSPRTGPLPGGGRRLSLVANDKFEMEVLELSGAHEIPGDASRFTCVLVIDGSARFGSAVDSQAASRGTSLLLPASLGSIRAVPERNCRLLVARPSGRR